MKRFLETGNFAIAEGAIIGGCRFFAGYPITPATELAESMSLRLPQVGGVYLQAEDECAAMHLCIGASLGGMKAMTATSGPGFILYADPYGWALGCENAPGGPELRPGGSGIRDYRGPWSRRVLQYPLSHPGRQFRERGPGAELGSRSHGHGR